MGESLIDIDVIIVTMSRWDNIYSSAIISLAKEISKSHRVFYFDHPYTLKDFISKYKSTEIKNRRNLFFWKKNSFKHLEEISPNFIAVTPGLTLPINWLPEGKIYDVLHKINNRIFISSLRKTIKKYNINRFIYLNSFDPFYGIDLPSDIKPLINIYQTRDDITGEAYIAKHGVRHEKEAVEKADFTLATSKELTRLKAVDSKNVIFMPNAANINIFKKAFDDLPKPAELTKVKGKILVYMGNIESRIDYTLLKSILTAHPDKTLVLVGPVSTNDLDDSGLRNFPNLVLTGGKKLAELPAYLKYADCTLIPFKCNQLTKSIYPLKINEYLAAGKPVVATFFSPDLMEFKDTIYLAEDHKTFEESINKALAEDSEEKINQRIKIAELNSWEARTKDFWTYVQQYIIVKSGKEYAEQQ